METGEAELLSSSDIGNLIFPVISTEYSRPNGGDTSAIGEDSNKTSNNNEQEPPTADSGDKGGNNGDNANNNNTKVRPFLLMKFTLYETKNKIYIVGSNARESRFRMLEIDITVPKDKLVIEENTKPCSRSEVMDVLSSLENDNKSLGGLTKRLTAHGILGFIRFTEEYYMLVITKRSVVSLLGGHYIYHIDSTELIPLAHSSVYRKPDRRSEEARFLSILQNLDLSKTFYFSYTYDITDTLQHNMTREKEKALGIYEPNDVEYNEMFVWNNSLLQPAMDCFEGALDWCIPIIHGFIDQAKISVCGKNILVAIIARRSHYFAGARFLKRGVNDQGNVANEVETEQIVTDLLTSSFHDPKDGLFNNPRYTSYVQHRGSIPLYWSQDVSNMSPKPPIELNSVDPFFSSAALHFSDMFARYGKPLMVLNLVKSRERIPRESKLLKEFGQCIQYLNQFLPTDSKIHYTAWDMSRASKSRNQEVIEFLENYADEALQRTGIFHNGKNLSGMEIQDGVCRTNCIDCLDRTNAAQFVIGKKALGYQLYALGVTDTTSIDYDSDAVNLLTEMFHDHGDTIALQYGGSHLVNTMETYRKINQWSSHSRDMIESIRRYYNNSFVDSQRQDAINLFLGNYVWQQGQPMLWDLPTDYYLHNDFFGGHKLRRSYQKWWIPNNLLPLHQRLGLQLEKVPEDEGISLMPYRGFYDNYWNEYYRPRTLSSLHTSFAFNMNSTSRYTSTTGRGSQETIVTGPFKSRKPEKPQQQQRSKEQRSTNTKKDNNHQQEKLLQQRKQSGSIISIRKEALKRASQMYRSQSFNKFLGYKASLSDVASTDTNVASSSATVKSSPSLRRPTEEEPNDNTSSSNSSDKSTPVNDWMEPLIVEADHQERLEYQKYLQEPPWIGESVESHPEYQLYNSQSSPDGILSSVKVNQDDYENYRQYYEKSKVEIPSIPIEQDYPCHDYYKAWINQEY